MFSLQFPLQILEYRIRKLLLHTWFPVLVVKTINNNRLL